MPIPRVGRWVKSGYTMRRFYQGEGEEMYPQEMSTNSTKLFPDRQQGLPTLVIS